MKPSPLVARDTVGDMQCHAPELAAARNNGQPTAPRQVPTQVCMNMHEEQ